MVTRFMTLILIILSSTHSVEELYNNPNEDDFILWYWNYKHSLVQNFGQDLFKNLKSQMKKSLYKNNSYTEIKC